VPFLSETVVILSEPILAVAIFEVVIGVVLLSRAADDFVEGAVNISAAARISPVVVGAVIVGFGTSAPELLVSSIAAFNGDLGLGVGNVIGSNVANLSLVLATAALIVPVLVTRAVLAREAPVALLSVLAFGYFVSTGGGLTRNEGIILLGGLVAVLVWTISTSRGPSDSSQELAATSVRMADVVRTGLGLVGTVAGAQLLVWGAMAIADIVGLTGGFVGFTLVAVGTSLPELVTAVVAARKNQTDLILGNLLGSNMFNSLAVGGVIATIGPGVIEDESLSSLGVIVMVGVSVIAWVAMVTRRRVYRIEGVLLLAIWLGAVVALGRSAGAV